MKCSSQVLTSLKMLFTDVDNSKSDALHHRRGRHKVGGVHNKETNYPKAKYARVG